jgi:cysteine desulfurase/selenocysteine lyase
VGASARASFYLYNTKAEVDALVEAVDEARSIFD